MKLNQSLPAAEYKKAVYVHYFGYGITYFNVGLGFILILLGIGKLVMGSYTEHTYIFLLGGAFLLIRPYLYVKTIVRNVLGAGKEVLELNLVIKEGWMEIAAGETNYSGPVKDLHSYRDKKGFILLYASKAQFFVLEKKQMTEREVEELITALEDAGLKKR